jgi:mannitol operon transcriptional antiterminator
MHVKILISYYNIYIERGVMMITSRMKKIIQILLDNEEYITISDIASEISVSSRTVVRELHNVTRWIDKNGAFLNKKKGRGIIFVEKDLSRVEMKELLYKTKSETIYTPADRGIVLRAELLGFEGSTKLYTLTRLLNVTESTISSDLEHLNPWFCNYNIQVIKKPGIGIFIKGSEISKRKAIVALIYEHFHTVELIEVISKHKNLTHELPKIESKIKKEILSLLNIEVLPYVHNILMAIEKEMGYQFTDNGYIALALRFSITLKRKEFWAKLALNEKEYMKLKKDRLYLFLKNFIEKNQNNPFNNLPEIELIYLTMHIKGTKLRQTCDYNKISMVEDFKVITLVKEFIVKTEVETGIYLTDNEKLVIDLVKHLRPVLYRLKMNLDIINPLLEEIKVMYPKLFRAIRRSVVVVESKELVEVPDDEIAYLAIHIGAVVHKTDHEILQKYKVVVACMYGMGASSFLMTQIKKNFPNIHVIQLVGVLDNQIEEIKSEEVDFLISTVPLKNMVLPYIIINPILKEEDKIKINDLMSHIQPYKRKLIKKKPDHLKKRLISFNKYSEIILEILKNYSYVKIKRLNHMQELIKFVSESLAIKPEEIPILEKSFAQREEKGSTILSKKAMILLHCRADISKKIALKIVQIEEPMLVRQETGKVPIETVVVMVAPVILDQKILEVLSEISRNVITENLLDVIKSENAVLIEEELSNILEKFYQKMVFANE